jgi:hypothetical protein
MCDTILVISLYLEQEVRIDEQEGQQLAAGTGVVARPGLLHGLAIADSLQERLRWSEYFCYLLLGLLSRANGVNFDCVPLRMGLPKSA